MEETLSFSPASLASNGKPESVTSISFAPKPISENTTILAAGLENGMIELWQVPVNGQSDVLKLACLFPPELCHIASITKLAWRPLGPSAPTANAQDENKLVLASCSMDHGCRIFNIEI
jgi:WD40 repeat protein